MWKLAHSRLSSRCWRQHQRKHLQQLSVSTTTTTSTNKNIIAGVQTIRTLLDKHIVGHVDTKECILLGLAAQEHIFIQGDPGTAKTYAAELAAETAGLKTYAVQFHRDTRLQDLIGDAIIKREVVKDGGGEIVRQSVERGGLLTAEVAVLDDLTRAPGEALNVLLRILNERTFQEQELPLKCAIATANAPRDDMYVEPLDPANLDRFALQVQSDGLILGNNWNAVSQVVDMYRQFDQSASIDDPAEVAKSVGSIDIRSVEMSEDVKECFILFLQWLSNHPAVTPRNSLLTDRTFLVKAPRVLRAQAALEGRSQVEVQDMIALRHMTTFRVPAAVHQEVCELLKLLAETPPLDDDNNHDDDEDDNQQQGGKDRNKMAGYLKNIIQQQFGETGPRIGGPRGGGTSDSQSKMNVQDGQEGDEDESRNSNARTKANKKKDGPEKDSIDHELLADIGGTSVLHATLSSFMTKSKDVKERTARPLRRLWSAFQGPHQIKLNLHSSAVSGAESVMAVVHGRSRRSHSPSNMQQVPGGVGQPRERGRLRCMGDPNLFQDGDPADISTWLSTPTSSLPRGLLRHPKKRGGTIALARDISDSMWGPRAALASATTQAAINLARQRGMRFGYCEFAGMPKFYNQRPPDHARHQLTEDFEMPLSQSTQLQDAFIEWGAGMAHQLGNLLGFQQRETTQKTNSSGLFFGTDYSFCESVARKLDTNGFTNLEEMLRQLLERFSVSGLPPHERHLLIITDGSPTLGSTTCVDESMLARTLGVSIHPIFVMDDDAPSGDASYPNVLKFLAEETNGVRFLAKHEVTVDERAEVEDREHAHLVRVKVELA